MRMKCSVFDHELVDGVRVTNPEHINFILKSVKDFRPQTEICRSCKISMEYVYERKMIRAKAAKLRKSKASSSLESVSTASVQNGSNASSASDTDFDAIDRLVTKTPLHKPKNRPSAGDSRNVSILRDSRREMVVGTPKRVTWQSPASNISSEIACDGSGSRVTFLQTAAPKSNLGPMSPLNTVDRASNTIHKSTGDSHLTATSIRHDEQALPLNVSNGIELISPTIYTNNEDAAHRNDENMSLLCSDISDENEGDVEHSQRYSETRINNHTLRDKSATPTVRLSQEPSTSAAAVTTSGVQQTPKTSGGAVPKLITDFLKPINPKGTTHAKTKPAPTKESSTSAASVSGRKRSFEERIGSSGDVSDDDEPRYSLSFFDGTRLPDVQPYVKKRPRQDTDVMARYVADITGG